MVIARTSLFCHKSFLGENVLFLVFLIFFFFLGKNMASRKIDVHAHFVPDFYRKALLDNGITNPDGMPGIPAWSVDSHLAYMDVGTHFQILPESELRAACGIDL